MDQEVRQFRMGAYNSLSGIQFSSTHLADSGIGSRRLSGESLNKPMHADSDIAVGPGHESPLALKSDTYGSANAAMAWRKSGILPYSTKTRGSTFSFE